MPKLNQSGFTQIFIIFALLLGLVVGVYLVQQKTNLLPKASEDTGIVPPLSSEQIIMPPVGECNYVPEGRYRLIAKVPQAHLFNIKLSGDPYYCSLIGEDYKENFVGTIGYEESNIWPTGPGDLLIVQDRLDRLCKARGLTGPICNLCRQKLRCGEYYVEVRLESVGQLSCSVDSDNRSEYNLSGPAKVRVYSLDRTGCKIEVEEDNVNVDVVSSYLGPVVIEKPLPTVAY